MIIFMCIGYNLASFDHMKTIELAYKAICGDFGSNCLVRVFYFRCINSYRYNYGPVYGSTDYQAQGPTETVVRLYSVRLYTVRQLQKLELR